MQGLEQLRLRINRLCSYIQKLYLLELNITPFIVSGTPNQLKKWHSNLYKYFPSIPCLDSVCTGAAVKKDFYIYPQIISMQHGDSINLFSKITLPPVGTPMPQNGILNFLRDSFLILRNRISTKTFFIKEIEGYNDFSVILNKLDKSDEFCKEFGDEKTAPQQITLQNVFIETSLLDLPGVKGYTRITISFEFRGIFWILSYFAKNLNPIDSIEIGKAKSLWRFKKDTSMHEGNLSSAGLTYLAKLSLTDYCARLPIIRDLFKRQTTKTFKEFLINLGPEEIINAMKEKTVTKTEWIEFEQQANQAALRQKLRNRTHLELKLEQQFRLQMHLKRLKTSLGLLKQKLELLSSKLEQLRVCLTTAI